MTSRILSKVFLFHFEKILGHFGLFQVFQDVSVNNGQNSRFGLKKKILKTKTNVHSIHRKSSKGKKKKEKKRKEMNKGTYTINYRHKCIFSPYILAFFFHFSPYILILPLLVPKSINAFHFGPFRQWATGICLGRIIKIIIKKIILLLKMPRQLIN